MVTEVKPEGISKKLFQLHYIIGIGGFGKVWKVVQKKNG